jgi:hypothetical protein
MRSKVIREDTQTHRQEGDRVSVLQESRVNKKCSEELVAYFPL